MIVLIGILQIVLDVVWWVIIAQVIVSWLVAFNVLNTTSAGVRGFLSALERVTGPIYAPIRKVLPDFGGIDFSPLVVLLLIALVEGRILEPLKYGQAIGT